MSRPGIWKTFGAKRYNFHKELFCRENLASRTKIRILKESAGFHPCIKVIDSKSVKSRQSIKKKVARWNIQLKKRSKQPNCHYIQHDSNKNGSNHFSDVMGDLGEHDIKKQYK